jgi:hypothetical protein
MSFEPCCLATAIGSLPHKDPQRAVEVVLQSIPDAPHWPKLPTTSLNEQLVVQCSEGIPRVVMDYEKGRIYINTAGDTSADLAAFYEKYVAEDFEACRISREFAKGLYAFESALQAAGGTRPFVKVQATGPLTVGLNVVDENKRAIYYNPEFADVVVKALAMNCRWQIRKFRSFAQQTICFLDDPILSAFGSSAYISVTRDDAVAKLSEVIEAIHIEGALAGVHCCGNTEWPILMDAGVDIVNFDAFDYGDTILLYPHAMKEFLKAGKALAFGIIPTNSAKIHAETVDSLVAKFSELVRKLAKVTGLEEELILRQALVAPACGAATLSIPDAELVYKILPEVSLKLRQQNKGLSLAATGE